MENKQCLNCNTVFYKYQRCNRDWNRQKYCSKFCSTKHSNSTKPRRHKKGECRTCKTAINKSKKFCSKDCLDLSKVNTQKSIEQKNNSRSQAVISWRIRTKQKAVNYKGSICKGCGYNKCIQALHFHHLDPTEKDFTISGKSWAWEKLKDELDKCILLCSNCHSEIHAGIRKI